MSGEATGFLYPMLDADERDAGRLLDDLARSARAKWHESDRLRAETLEACAPVLVAAARAMAARFADGGRLLTFGNGGSATDAAAVVDLFTRPPRGRPLPARSLAQDAAVLSALANDIGADVLFSRQLIAHGRSGDIALAISTSGNSENLCTAMAEAARRGMLTIGLAGYDGGRLAASPDVEHCLVARSQSVHRVQEAQAAVAHALWAAVQEALDGRPTEQRSSRGGGTP